MVVLELRGFFFFYDHYTHRFATICKLGKVRTCLEEIQKIDEIMNSVSGVYGMIKKTDKKLTYLLRTKVSVIQTLIITNVFIISTRL